MERTKEYNDDKAVFDEKAKFFTKKYAFSKTYINYDRIQDSDFNL